MQKLAAASLMMICASGCVSAVSETAALDRLNPLATRHAAALAGDDAHKMRRTGFDLIAAFDAARGVQ